MKEKSYVGIFQPHGSLYAQQIPRYKIQPLIIVSSFQSLLNETTISISSLNVFEIGYKQL